MRTSSDPIRLADANRPGVTADESWFAVQTKPRSEETAIVFLSQRDIVTFLPRLQVKRRHGSRKWEILEPLFPGYLFARFAPEAHTVDKVRWAPGIRKILGCGEVPIPVPEEIVMYLQERVGERGFMIWGPSFVARMRVRFKGGPLAHLEGLIERPVSRVDRVRVLLELLGRPVAVEVDVAELELA